MNETILVTGGAGYVGSHACKALAAAGFTPVVYDSLERGHRWAVKWGPFEHGNILDQERLNAAIAHHNPIAVMHFAAYAYVGESVTAPRKYYRNNVIGTLNLLDAMQKSGIRAIVFSSSCATYGIPTASVIDENQPQAPLSPYGASKLMVERILADCNAADGLQYATLRYFNAAGADPDGEIGEIHEPETHLIPLALQAARSGRETLAIFGNDYPTPDGTCIRDYVHVSDLAEAHVSALEQLLNGTGSLILNLGSGIGISVIQLIREISRITGRVVPHEFSPRRLGDAPILVASNTLAKEKLGWNTDRSNIENIIRTAAAWEAGKE